MNTKPTYRQLTSRALAAVALLLNVGCAHNYAGYVHPRVTTDSPRGVGQTEGPREPQTVIGGDIVIPLSKADRDAIENPPPQMDMDRALKEKYINAGP